MSPPAALVIALTNTQTVFALVLDARGVFASAFGPLLLLSEWGKRVSERAAIQLMAVGVGTFYLWSLYGRTEIYAIAPAWGAVMLMYLLLRNRW